MNDDEDIRRVWAAVRVLKAADGEVVLEVELDNMCSVFKVSEGQTMRLAARIDADAMAKANQVMTRSYANGVH